MKKYIITLTLVVVSLFTISCNDDFADVNTDPSAVTKGDPSFLFAQSILEFEPQGYTYWFYNASSIFQWVQTGVSTGGASSTIADGAPSQNFKAIDVLKYANELKYVRSTMAEEESAQYAKYAAAMDVLCVYMGIFDSDFIGNIPYTEAAQAAHGGTLTPKYDQVEDLYNLWLTSLDEDIRVLTTATDQVFLSAQDPVYRGKTESWAKLANSLKLKIAARMISQNRVKALEVAREVATASCGVISSEAEDFLFNKATSSTSSNDYAYHWENGVLTSVGGSQTMIDFMVNNRDPRVRFIFKKNTWNAKVVQLFFDAKRENDVPKYIMDNVDYEVGTGGIYKFKGWKGAGEPWVRYYGLPLAFDAGQQAGIYGDWFNYDVKCKYDANYTYRPYSMFQDEMIYGRINFTYPTIPGDAAIQDIEDTPWWGMYMTTAEVNLYLAEFSLLGANLPEGASSYYNKAIAASVKEYNRLAKENKIPYYGATYNNYDPFEKSIDLVDGEIETMMSNPSYKLTGDKASDLEKVYIQQVMHFSMQPIDQYATARRSGVPKIGSSIFPRADYSQVPTSSIPRRMALNQPAPTDLMYNVLVNSYKEQGFTVGSGTILNSERVWQDKDAPQWGQGPK
ncbi:SusD/RagB family nutrient-binding outer membrane lipoprotein [Dysgonomonas sp. ZJ279]|uniref:SusD/RagB family nutrient-binding outer membrane lipoprotein n=1 Tax=Dysgonomonas sp. ZJ279 TaxID=2709796 RepID=UPI0013E9C7B3|nr:SusD/RagB family nutrient-binding outer membrane lipoprotein [Dysgonomonas sp. ZJ279]